MYRFTSTFAVIRVLAISRLVAGNVNATNATAPATGSNVMTTTAVFEPEPPDEPYSTTDSSVETTVLSSTTKPDPNVKTTTVATTTYPDPDAKTTVMPSTKPDSNATTVAISTESPVDPCSPNPCPETFICNPGADAAYTCQCEEGFEKVESQCVKTECNGYVETVSNTAVYYDVEADACGNRTYYSPSGETVVVYFDKALVGTTVVANVTCNTPCEDGDSNTIPLAIGVVACEVGEKFSTSTWIDCSITDPNLEQHLTRAIIQTSNSDIVNTTIVADSVQLLEEVANQNNITTQLADDFLKITNNLLRASSDDAISEVQGDAESITNSVQQVTGKVDLKPVDSTYSFYENQRSDIAMAVVQQNVTASTVGGTYYYGTNGIMHPNLAVTNLEISTSKPNGSYISVVPNAAADRVSIVIYSDIKDLFPNYENLDILSKNLVYSVSDGEVAMRFPIKEDIIITSDNNVFNGSKKLDCVRWTSGKWVTGSTCTKYKASDFYASCTCTQEGEYTIRANALEVIVDDEGLSPGAIAGIVIGSVVGVALIGGLAFHFYKKKQK